MDKEQGKTGLNRWGGNISEEFLPELRGIEGVKVYREMSDNDDIIGAVLFAIKILIPYSPMWLETHGPELVTQLSCTRAVVVP